MREFRTNRMIMRTNIEFGKRKLIFPPDNNSISFLDKKPHVIEDGGFIFYSENHDLICHIAVRDDRKCYELSYGTEEKHRGQGYMQEALTFVLSLFEETFLTENIYALISDNPESKHILEKVGFKHDSDYELGGKWFVYEMKHKET